MTRVVTTVFAVAASALPWWPGAASAHDVWITLQGPSSARRAIVNYGHPFDRPPAIADKILDIFAVTRDRQESLIEGLATVRDGGWLVVETAPFHDTGRMLVTVRYDNGYWIKTADGYRNATNREATGAQQSLWSMKFAKALTGPGAPWDRVMGHDLEIVPMSDPLSVRPGQSLRLRVLFRSQPLAGGSIERGDGVTAVPEADIPRFATDGDGVAEVPIVKAGPIQLVVDHSVSPSATPGLADTDMFNATLWYVVPR